MYREALAALVEVPPTSLWLHSERRGGIATAPLRQYFCQDHGVRSVRSGLSQRFALPAVNVISPIAIRYTKEVVQPLGCTEHYSRS